MRQARTSHDHLERIGAPRSAPKCDSSAIAFFMHMQPCHSDISSLPNYSTHRTAPHRINYHNLLHNWIPRPVSARSADLIDVEDNEIKISFIGL